MRVLAVADLHGSQRGAAVVREGLARLRPDALVVAGDLTQFGPLEYAETLLAGLSVPVLAVPGNCDPREIVPVLERLGASLHGRKAVVAGRTFVGAGGANPTPFGTPFDLEEAEIAALLDPVMEPGAVLVSHAPPRGAVDAAWSGEHVGSTAVRATIDRFRPPLVLCGHIHEARGIERVGETTVVNVGPAMLGRCALVEIDREVRVQLL